MSENRMHRERLDALLAGLEDEVIRSEEGRAFSGETMATTRVGATRSAIESLIRGQLGVSQGRQELLLEQEAGGKGAKAKLARAMERLGRWVGVTQTEDVVRAPPQVRMAFSGGRSRKRRKTEPSAEKQRRHGKDGGGEVDR